MTSLCSEASSSVSSRPQQGASWDRSNDEKQKMKTKKSAFIASPWEREKKEKLQQEQMLDARRARDQEIAHLESMTSRSEKQSEWLRILRLEREFQRRAEQEPDDEEGSVCSDTDSADENKISSFPRDKLTVIPNERIGLKLLNELLDTSSKNGSPPDKSTNNDRQLQTPSDNHFIPLDIAIPAEHPQPMSLPITNNILKISTEQQHVDDKTNNRPVPAPRPSKSVLLSHLAEFHGSLEMANPENIDLTAGQFGLDMEANASSLTKLDISDSCALFCSTDDQDRSSNDSLQENWCIEVPSCLPDREGECSKQKLNEQQRIYENIKTTDFQGVRTQLNSYSSNTLPRSSSLSSTASLVSKDTLPARNGTRPFEKKFPAMGVSSTLTKKANGYVPSDADILPSLYASYKQVQNGHVPKDVPSDLADKSPEFKKMWMNRPEKLTFQDKIRKFSIQAGEDDAPKDKVKNSRAQREIEIKFSEAQKRAAAQKTSEN